MSKKGIKATFGDKCFIREKSELIATGDMSEDLFRHCDSITLPQKKKDCNIFLTQSHIPQLCIKQELTKRVLVTKLADEKKQVHCIKAKETYMSFTKHGTSQMQHP